MLARTSRADTFRLLGSELNACDVISRWRGPIRALLRTASREELDLMMTPEERAELAAMPEHFTVYRGCYAINRAGLSWTTHREIAEGWTLLGRFHRPGEQPLLRIGTVSRGRAVLKLDRHEQEIIAHYVKIDSEEAVSVERARKALATAQARRKAPLQETH
jgi:hypothetical protein